MKQVLLMMMSVVMLLGEASHAWGRSFVVATNGNDNGSGSLSEPWRTIGKANRTLVAGDTVYIMTGTYTEQINPSNSGSPGQPLVYMNYQANVCSLYVNATVLSLTNKSYVIVQGLRLQMAYSVNNSVVTISGGAHNAILNCHIYGGSTHNNPAWGDWPAIKLSGTNYCRLIGNVVDRQDHDITSDALRGDGICVFGDSKYNIVEGNTILNVSHFGIAVPYGVPGESFNIVRYNRAYDCHVGIGNTDYTSRCLYEGNLAWSPGEVNTYRGGISCEFSPRNSIIRYNAFYDDSTSVGSLMLNPGSNNGFVTNTAVSTPIDNRVYHNVFMGKSGTASDRHSLMLQNDSPGVYDFGRNVFVNNIIAYPNTRAGSFAISWQDRGKTFNTVSDTFRCNLVWAGVPGAVVANWGVQGGLDARLTLDQLKAHMPMVWDPSNFESSPLWRDSIATQEHRNFSLSSGSSCVDRAIPLTMTVRPTTAANAIYVSDASYFHYAWGDSPYDRGDSISVDGVRAELQSVDYRNNILYTTAEVTVGVNKGVFVAATFATSSGYQSRMNGIAPDVGVSEYALDVPIAQVPGAPALPMLTSSSAPLPLSGVIPWSNPPHALWYQIQVSTASAFASNIIDETDITATAFPLASLGVSTAYFARVKAFNRMGESPWSSVVQFTTTSGTDIPGKDVTNLVSNGNFESGLTGWAFYTNGTGSFTASGPSFEGALAGKVCITAANTNMQAYRSGLVVEPMTRYRLTFAAKSSTGHDLSISLIKEVAPYTNYGVREWDVDLGMAWQSYTLEFTTANISATASDALLQFWFSSYASPGDEYMIDDVVLTRLGAAAVESPQAGIPLQHMLSQNYPNPFNPETRIRFALPVQEHVQLMIYDITGAEVAVVYDGTPSAGAHEAVFDAGNLATGTYIAVLRTDSFVDKRKMLLVR